MNNYGNGYPPHDPPPPYSQSTGCSDVDFRVTSMAVRHEVTATSALDEESAEPPPPYYAVVPPCALGDARIVAPMGVRRREVGVTVITQPDYSRESYKCHSVLACFVLGSGNVVFGVVAYFLAARAERAKRWDHKAARRLGRGSLLTSIGGLITTVITATVIVLVVSGDLVNCDTAYYVVNGHCYAYRRYVFDDPGCAESFSTCCRRYESKYSDGYCYGNYPDPWPPTTSTASVSTTTTAPSVTTCLPELFVYGRCYRSRRRIYSKWLCRGPFPLIPCCTANETYDNGYCYS